MKTDELKQKDNTTRHPNKLSYINSIIVVDIKIFPKSIFLTTAIPNTKLIKGNKNAT
jgi:hypothetical protein